MRIIIFIFFFYSIYPLAFAGKYDCIIASKKYELIYNLPKNLLISISLVESGKKIKDGDFISWPWTINMGGKGKFFDNKDKALNYTKNFINKGKKNIDIGCMQINYMYHPKAFKSFDDAFDPDKNVEWAAKMLNSLYKKFGSWKEAVGYYHSYRNSRRKKYSAKVFKTWLSIKNKDNFEFIRIAEHETVDRKNNIIKKNIEPLLIAKNDDLNKKNIIKKETAPTHSDYILTRMEKVEFFREYFKNLRKN